MPRSLSEHVARFERGSGSRRRHSLEWLRHVDVVDFLERLDIANINQINAEQVAFSCPFPDHTHGDESPSAAMNNGSAIAEKATRWKCFGCGRDGNAIDFLSEYLNISQQQARLELRETYASGYIAPKYGSIAREFDEQRRARKRNTVTELPSLGFTELKRFDVDWSHYAEEHEDQPDVRYMLDRGFTPAALDEWGIGYDYDSQRITIPVCIPDGDLVGFKGRAWKPDAHPKYLVLGDKGKRQRYGFPTYDKTRVVFGLDMWREVETYVLVEGEIDVMSLWVMNIPAICVGGSSMSPTQAKLIRQYCDKVVLFFDNDPAGRNAVYGIDKKDGTHKPGVLEQLEPFVRVSVVGRHRYDANDYLRRGEAERVRGLVAGAISSHLL